MEKWKIIFLILGGFVFVINGIIVTQHEEYHKEIFNQYGIHSEIKYHPNDILRLWGETIPNMEDYKRLTQERIDQLSSLQLGLENSTMFSSSVLIIFILFSTFFALLYLKMI